jgi:hypothetical protein
LLVLKGKLVIQNAALKIAAEMDSVIMDFVFAMMAMVKKIVL